MVAILGRPTTKSAIATFQRAVAAHDTAASRAAAVDAKFTKERMGHEADNRRYRAGLVAGTERLRIAVSSCSATSPNGVSATAGTAGVGDGATAVAELDRATAERIFAVAGDDQREIDKLKALQDYVCAIRPGTLGCDSR
nr:lysis system i-spanin subunit Rz [Burkholderia perseverans]